MGDKSSSQSTEIPPAGAQEQSLMDLITSSVVPAYMDQAGYEVTPTRVGTFQESKAYAEIQSERQKARNRIAEIDRLLDQGPVRGLDAQSLSREKDTLKDRIDELNDQEEDGIENFVPYTEYDSRKRGTAREEAYRDAYVAEHGSAEGIEDEPDYKAIVSEERQKTVDVAAQKEEIGNLFMDKVQKYLSGDFSVTPEQEEYISKQFAPIKASIDEMYSGRFSELEERYQDFSKQVSNTSLKVGDALRAVGEQIQTTGKNMETVLASTIETNKELMKMGIEDKTGEITKKVSNQAIMTGRDPSDPEFQQEIQVAVAREIKYGTLNLAEMESRGKLSIAERTGSGMEEVNRAMARLAEREGGLLENAVLAEGQEKAGLIQGQGEANTRLEEAKANLRQSIGMGMVPGQIQTGSGFMSLDQALANQRLANASAPMGVVGGATGYYQGDRRAQPTSTSTQPFDWFGATLGLGSTAVSAYSGISEANANNSMADWYTIRA